MSEEIQFGAKIVDEYDAHLGPVMFTPFAKDLIAHISAISSSFPKEILEVASGTGRLTREILEKVHGSSNEDSTRIIATDLSKDMLELGKKNLPPSSQLTWQLADMTQLPFENGAFDCVVSQFGVMFVPDKLIALTEIYRVLQPEGSFVFNVWNRETTFFADFLQLLLKERANVTDEGTLASYLSKGEDTIASLFSCSDEATIVSQLMTIGYQNVSHSKKAFLTEEEEEIRLLGRGMLLGSIFTQFLGDMNSDQIERLLETLIQEMIRKKPIALVANVYSGTK